MFEPILATSQSLMKRRKRQEIVQGASVVINVIRRQITNFF
jgi:hypothetical protein